MKIMLMFFTFDLDLIFKYCNITDVEFVLYVLHNAFSFYSTLHKKEFQIKFNIAQLKLIMAEINMIKSDVKDT